MPGLEIGAGLSRLSAINPRFEHSADLRPPRISVFPDCHFTPTGHTQITLWAGIDSAYRNQMRPSAVSNSRFVADKVSAYTNKCKVITTHFKDTFKQAATPSQQENNNYE